MLVSVIKNFISLQRSQWFDGQKISKIQSKKLREVILHAYRNVAFYKELYSRAGVELNKPIVLEKLPFVTKEDLRNVPLESRVLRGIISKKHHVIYTSGSSGMPFKIVQDSREVAIFEALRIRSILAQGARFTDKVCQLRPVSVGGEQQFYLLAERKRFYGFIRKGRARPIPLTSQIDAHLEVIEKWKPQILFAPPSYLVALMDYCEKIDRRPAFRIVRSSGEVLTARVRKAVSDFFQAEVYDNYGAAEVGSIAWECPAREGYHINAETVFVEVLRDGHPVSPGEEGEICVTSLYRYTTPFIRYLLGDIVTLLDDECSCGRGLPLLGKIHGRMVDVIVRRDGLPVFPLTILHSFHDIEGLDRFKVVQRSDYVIEVYIKPRVGWSEEAVKSEVEKRCNILFPDTPYTLKIVEEFENNAAKFRPVI